MRSRNKQTTARKPRFGVFVAAIIVVIAVVIVLRMGRTASVPIPKIPTANLSPARKAIVEKARHALESEETADAWGQYGMVLHAFDFNTEAIRCFQTAQSLDPRNPRWPYFISRIRRANRPAESTGEPAGPAINDEFEDELAVIRRGARD